MESHGVTDGVIPAELSLAILRPPGLASQKAKLNAKRSDGHTAMHIAIQNRKVDAWNHRDPQGTVPGNLGISGNSTHQGQLDAIGSKCLGHRKSG